jgi:hypothetical protein
MADTNNSSGAKSLGFLIKAELDKAQFTKDIEAQLKGLQAVIDGKTLKIDVDLGEAKQLKQATDNIGKGMAEGMKASEKEMEKMRATAKKLQDQIKQMNKEIETAMATSRKDFEERSKQSIIAQMKAQKVKRPSPTDPLYQDWNNSFPAQKIEKEGKKTQYRRPNADMWTAHSSKKGTPLDVFADSVGLTPSQVMEIAKGGTPQFSNKDIDPATKSGIEQNEKRIKEYQKELEKVQNAIKNQVSLSDTVEKNIDDQTKAVKKQEQAVENLSRKWKTVSIATTSVGEGKDAEPVSRVINSRDNLGNRSIVREVKDEEDGSWKRESETYIATLKEIEDAKKKFQIKGEKWSDRLANLHAKAFKLNDKDAITSIQNLQRQYEKFDATTDKLDMQKFDQDLKKVEKSAKDQYAVYDKIIKKQKELRELNATTYKAGVFNDKDIRKNYDTVSNVDANGGEKSLAELEKIENKMRERIAVLKEEQAIRNKLESAKKADASKEETRIKKLTADQEKYLNKIKDYQSKGLLNSSRADMYSNTAKKSGTSEELAKLDKYFTLIDRVIAKEKTRTTHLNQQMQVAKRLSAQDTSNITTTEKLEKAKEGLLKKIRDLGASGKSTNEKLQRIGKSINTADSLDQLAKLQAKIEGIYTNDKKTKATQKEIADQKKLEKAKVAYYEKIAKYEQMGLGQGSANRYKKMADNGEFDRLDKSIKALDRYMVKQKQLSDDQDKMYQQDIARQRKDAESMNTFIANREKARKEVARLANQGKLTIQQIQNMARELNKVQKGDEKHLATVRELIRGYKQLASSKPKASSEDSSKQNTNQPNYSSLGTIANAGSLNLQRDLNELTDEHIRQVIRSNDQYKNRRIVTSSVDRATGKWTATIQENGRQERVLRGEIDRTNASLRVHSDTLRDTSARNMGFLEQFKIALTRVPVWAMAMTAIYGTKRAIEQMTATVVELDTQMTELKRVMSDDTDFNNMLEQSVQLSKELGNNLTDVNNAMIGFARQGFKGQDAIDMTKTAVVASNVSELGADEAMEDLTAIMVQFNIAAEDSIRIVDSLNEVNLSCLLT